MIKGKDLWTVSLFKSGFEEVSLGLAVSSNLDLIEREIPWSLVLQRVSETKVHPIPTDTLDLPDSIEPLIRSSSALVVELEALSVDYRRYNKLPKVHLRPRTR